MGEHDAGTAAACGVPSACANPASRGAAHVSRSLTTNGSSSNKGERDLRFWSPGSAPQQDVYNEAACSPPGHSPCSPQAAVAAAFRRRSLRIDDMNGDVVCSCAAVPVAEPRGTGIRTGAPPVALSGDGGADELEVVRGQMRAHGTRALDGEPVELAATIAVAGRRALETGAAAAVAPPHDAAGVRPARLMSHPFCFARCLPPSRPVGTHATGPATMPPFMCRMCEPCALQRCASEGGAAAFSTVMLCAFSCACAVVLLGAAWSLSAIKQREAGAKGVWNNGSSTVRREHAPCPPRPSRRATHVLHHTSRRVRLCRPRAYTACSVRAALELQLRHDARDHDVCTHRTWSRQ